MSIVVRVAARARRPRRHLAQPIAVIVTALLLLGVPFWLVIVTAGKNQAEALNPNLNLPTH